MPKKKLIYLSTDYHKVMSSSPNEFVNLNLAKLGFASKKDIIENLFIKSLTDSYNRIVTSIGIENEIRDRFVKDLHQTDSKLKKWLQLKYIYLDWENWVFASDYELKRTDISFKLSGLEFIVECKRLKSVDNAYISEGLDRFINLIYSQFDEYSGMIGFVISGDKSQICEGLKSKIDNLSHTKSTTLHTNLPSFISNHTRINQSEIGIYHLFFDFNGVKES